jgi:two-component system cell cycle response regulator DivK
MSGRRVLVVDDDAAARRMMRRILERRGFAVEEAGDGRSGVEAVQAAPPDVVLLDLRMPGELSGADVVRELRADPATSGVPIIVVSASAHMNARELVRSIGCDGFVEKPVDFDELDAALERVLGSA